MWIMRNILRQKNLHDTTHEPVTNQPAIEPMQARYLTARTSDGTYNDLKNPAMGMAGSRFGRNIPIEYAFPEPVLTVDFKPEVYTQVGMDWIRDNTMSTILLRHYPHLRSALGGVDNAFTPWVKANV